MIHLLPNYSQLLIKYKQDLIPIQLLMRDVYFLISQKSLIKSGIVVFCSSYKLMVLKVNFLLYLKMILIIVKKRLVLNSQMPDWRKINSGVLQGSVLGPLLLLIFVNDLPNGIASIRKIFANETCFFSKVHVVDIFSRVKC